MFQPPDPPEDVRLVIDAAAHLRIGEFDLFRLAWQRWSGRDADEKALERTFVAYMFHHVVPSWARQFAREVMAAVSEGRLDRRAFGADGVKLREPIGRGNPAYLWLTALVFFVFFRFSPDDSSYPGDRYADGLRVGARDAYLL